MNTRETQISFEVGLLVSSTLAEAADPPSLLPSFLYFFIQQTLWPEMWQALWTPCRTPLEPQV